MMNQLFDYQIDSELIEEICKESASLYSVSFKALSPVTNLYLTIINKNCYKNRVLIATSLLKKHAENEILLLKSKILKGLASTVKPLEDVEENELKTADEN